MEVNMDFKEQMKEYANVINKHLDEAIILKDVPERSY